MKLIDNEFIYFKILPISKIDKVLIYKILNNESNKLIDYGFLVKIPLIKRSIFGIILEKVIITHFPLYKIKIIEDIVYDFALFSNDLILLCKWTAIYYMTSLSLILKTIIPKIILKKIEYQKTNIFIKKILSKDDYLKLMQRAPKQAKLYNFLFQQQSYIDKKEVLKIVNISNLSYKSLIKQKIIGEQDATINFKDFTFLEKKIIFKKHELNKDQSLVFNDINNSLKKKNLRCI